MGIAIAFALADAINSARRVIQFDDHERRLVALMHAAQSGDRAAFESLVRASTPFIRKVARGQGVPPDLIDDVVQESLIAIHCNRQNYDSSRPFTAWLRTIVQRRAIDVMRRQRRTAQREVHEPLAFENHADPANSPEDNANHVDRNELLGVAAASLPARQRDAVMQLAILGKSLLEATAATGQTAGALRVNLHRAIKTLQARFGGEQQASLVPALARRRGHNSNTAHVFVNAAV